MASAEAVHPLPDEDGGAPVKPVVGDRLPLAAQKSVGSEVLVDDSLHKKAPSFSARVKELLWQITMPVRAGTANAHHAVCSSTALPKRHPSTCIGWLWTTGLELWHRVCDVVFVLTCKLLIDKASFLDIRAQRRNFVPTFVSSPVIISH